MDSLKLIRIYEYKDSLPWAKVDHKQTQKGFLLFFIFVKVWTREEVRKDWGWWWWDNTGQEESQVEAIMMGGMFPSPFLSTGGAWKWSVETEWNGQELTAESQRKEEPRTRAQTNAIVVNAQWVPQSDCRGPLNKDGIAIPSSPPN